jgi:hypothetical protein
MEMLKQADNALRAASLRLLLSVVANDTPVLESLCLVGIVPIVNELTAARHHRSLRRHAAEFVERLCSTSAHTVQMFVACGGLSVLVGVSAAASLLPGAVAVGRAHGCGSGCD